MKSQADYEAAVKSLVYPQGFADYEGETQPQIWSGSLNNFYTFHHRLIYDGTLRNCFKEVDLIMSTSNIHLKEEIRGPLITALCRFCREW